MKTPSRLTAAAIAQLVSGVVNLFGMWWLASMFYMAACGSVTALLTAGACPFGTVCGLAPWLLIPLGLLEVIAGILGLASPRSAVVLIKVTAVLEILALAAGGLGSLVAGIIALVLASGQEIAAWRASQA